MNVQTWCRLFSYVLRHWRPLAWSVTFGGLSALLWSIELSLAFPMTVMLGPDQTLDRYVQREINETHDKVEQAKSTLQSKELFLKDRPDDGTSVRGKERVRLLNEVRRLQQELETHSFRLWWLSSLKAKLLPRLPSDPFRLFAMVSVLILIVTLVKGLSSFTQDTLAGGVAERVAIDLRQELFRRTLKLDPQTVALGGVPQLMTDFTYTLHHLAHHLADVCGRIIREPLKALSCIGMMLYLNWQLTLLLLVFVPISGWLFHQLGRRMKRAAYRVLDGMAAIYANLEETFVNVKATFVCNAAGRQRRQFHRRSREFYLHSMKLVRIDALTGAAVECLAVFAILAVLLPVAYLSMRGQTSIAGVKLATVPPSIPALATFYALLAGVIDPLRKFAKFYTTIRYTESLGEQIFRQMDRQTLVTAATEPQWLPSLKTAITFEDVHFTYARAKEEASSERGPVLTGLDFAIQAGETVAIVGPNGSGKSTLVNLLPRFADPERGRILFDGVDLRSVRLRELRDQLAIVSQETSLFDTTIAANIGYGRVGASEADVLEAARRAYVLEFTDTFPLGLSTPVGEGGRQLSGGQRQRVALARAILRDPRVLILDEPTSAIDAESETLIHRALKTFVQGRTTFIITHSLSTALLDYVSRLIVIDGGKVIATGSHSQLVATCPLYRQLFEGQIRSAA